MVLFIYRDKLICPPKYSRFNTSNWYVGLFNITVNSKISLCFCLQLLINFCFFYFVIELNVLMFFSKHVWVFVWLIMWSRERERERERDFILFYFYQKRDRDLNVYMFYVHTSVSLTCVGLLSYIKKEMWLRVTKSLHLVRKKKLLVLFCFSKFYGWLESPS